MPNHDRILNMLMEARRVDEDEIYRMLRADPDESIRLAASLLHGLFCDLDHDCECSFYDPTEKGEGDRELWLCKTVDMLQDIGSFEVESITEYIREASSILQSLDLIWMNLPRLFGMIHDVIERRWQIGPHKIEYTHGQSGKKL